MNLVEIRKMCGKCLTKKECDKSAYRVAKCEVGVLEAALAEAHGLLVALYPCYPEGCAACPPEDLIGCDVNDHLAEFESVFSRGNFSKVRVNPE